MEKWHPDFIDLLSELVDRNQVELIGGAYYEPVISVIPDSDALGQISLLSDKAKSLFHKETSGFWTAERAWEPDLPELLSKAEATHTFIDDVSFESAGLDEVGCFEPYLVESRGSFITVFPILKKLRYFIPFKPVSTTISYLRNSTGRSIALYADDGEKFGAWPSTFDRVYKERWLDTFLTELERKSWIETVRVSEYLAKFPPQKRIYLPASAYSEMMEWAIPLFAEKRSSPKIQTKEVSVPQRGFWRLFLAKYPESARIYSKMLRVSEAIHSGSLDNEPVEPVIDLWKGQCNDAYWHGVFGGLYAAILRKITYENLIRAQVGYESRTFNDSDDWLETKSEKHGGYEEININTRMLDVAVSPSSGGAICEIDYKPRFVNIVDTLTRRKERYHSEVRKKSQRTIVPDNKNSKESGLGKLLIYDRYEKFAFVDYLVPSETEIESFVVQNFKEIAPLAVCGYESKIQKSNDSIQLDQRSSAIGRNGELIEIQKHITVPSKEAKVKAGYDLRFSKTKPGSFLFLPEINIGTLSDPTFVKNFGKPRVLKTDRVKLVHEQIGLETTLNVGGSRETWLIPVRTVSLSEEGFESNLQCVSILPKFEIDLTGDKKEFSTTVELQLHSA